MRLLDEILCSFYMHTLNALILKYKQHFCSFWYYIFQNMYENAHSFWIVKPIVLYVDTSYNQITGTRCEKSDISSYDFFMHLDKVLRCSHDWLCTHYIDQAILKLKRSIYLHLPPLLELEAYVTITCLTMVFQQFKTCCIFQKEQKKSQSESVGPSSRLHQ